MYVYTVLIVLQHLLNSVHYFFRFYKPSKQFFTIISVVQFLRLLYPQFCHVGYTWGVLATSPHGRWRWGRTHVLGRAPSLRRRLHGVVSSWQHWTVPTQTSFRWRCTTASKYKSKYLIFFLLFDYFCCHICPVFCCWEYLPNSSCFYFSSTKDRRHAVWSRVTIAM